MNKISIFSPPIPPAGDAPGPVENGLRATEGALRAVIAPHAAQLQMLELAARLAVLGSIRVLDGGNQFNPLPVARAIRRLTLELEPALAGIRISRAFTCYQVLALLEQEPAQNRPVLVLDLLATFYDESVPLPEASRLLRACLVHLRRLSAGAPVVVSARPPKPVCAERQVLLDELRSSAPLLSEWEEEEFYPQIKTDNADKNHR